MIMKCPKCKKKMFKQSAMMELLEFSKTETDEYICSKCNVKVIKKVSLLLVELSAPTDEKED